MCKASLSGMWVLLPFDNNYGQIYLMAGVVIGELRAHRSCEDEAAHALRITRVRSWIGSLIVGMTFLTVGNGYKRLLTELFDVQ